MLRPSKKWKQKKSEENKKRLTGRFEATRRPGQQDNEKEKAKAKKGGVSLFYLRFILPCHGFGDRSEAAKGQEAIKKW